MDELIDFLEKRIDMWKKDLPGYKARRIETEVILKRAKRIRDNSLLEENSK